MKSTFFIALALIASVSLSAQGVVGKWKTIDDKTGLVKSIVEIREQNGELYGKIIQLFRSEWANQNPKCTECKDDRKDQPMIGMDVVRNMKWNGSMFKDGTICDPNNGDIYRCEMWLKAGDPNRLELRGYWGFVYRTQTWERVQ